MNRDGELADVPAEEVSETKVVSSTCRISPSNSRRREMMELKHSFIKSPHPFQVLGAPVTLFEHVVDGWETVTRAAERAIHRRRQRREGQRV